MRFLGVLRAAGRSVVGVSNDYSVVTWLEAGCPEVWCLTATHGDNEVERWDELIKGEVALFDRQSSYAIAKAGEVCYFKNYIAPPLEKVDGYTIYIGV